MPLKTKCTSDRLALLHTVQADGDKATWAALGKQLESQVFAQKKESSPAVDSGASLGSSNSAALYEAQGSRALPHGEQAGSNGVPTGVQCCPSSTAHL